LLYSAACALQVREHAISFFNSLCDMILAGADVATSAPRDLDPRSTRDLDIGPRSARDLPRSSPRDLDGRSGSLKRKHVGSTPSLSDVGDLDAGTNGSRLSPPPSAAVSEEDSSSSSLSACSSSNALICDDEAAWTWPDDEATLDRGQGHGLTSASFRDSLRISESDGARQRAAGRWDSTALEPNRNVLLLPAMCPNVSLGADDAVRPASPGSDVVVFEGSEDRPPECPASANVLVVSHGGFISQLLGHFADDYQLRVPGGGAKVTATVTPNAGLSRFWVSVDEDAGRGSDGESKAGRKLVWIRCVALHDKDHLANDVDVEPLPMSEPL